jgi:hypothetical protein
VLQPLSEHGHDQHLASFWDLVSVVVEAALQREEIDKVVTQETTISVLQSTLLPGNFLGSVEYCRLLLGTVKAYSLTDWLTDWLTVWTVAEQIVS